MDTNGRLTDALCPINECTKLPSEAFQTHILQSMKTNNGKIITKVVHKKQLLQIGKSKTKKKKLKTTPILQKLTKRNMQHHHNKISKTHP